MTQSTTVARVARTPKPPYYSVSTTTELAAGFDEAAYFKLATALYGHAQEIDGFLGLEAFFQDGASVATTYWASLEAIQRWRDDPRHMVAKQKARNGWFGPTITRIARVERDYGFNLDQA